MMYINIENVEKILAVMKKFPDAKFYLENDNSSGIGNIMTLTVHTQVNGLAGEFKTEISGVENW